MDVSTPCDDSAWEYVNSTSDDAHAHVNRQKCMSSISLTSEDNVVAECGKAFCEFLPIQELMSGCSLATSEEEFYSQEKENLYEEHKLNQIKSSAAASEKVFVKCATFPCSKKLGCSVSTIGNDDRPDVVCDELCSTKSDKPACTRSISLPTSLKLVSALKGSRQRQGIHEKVLTVTWAPNVYDPPVTSLSHTVKGYSQQQRSRTNKKNSKHKHKGKSSRTSSEKKQYRKHSGNSEPRSKSQETSNELFQHPTVDLLDFSVTGQESNCGSSFLRTSVGKVHIPFAEAT